MRSIRARVVVLASLVVLCLGVERASASCYWYCDWWWSGQCWEVCDNCGNNICEATQGESVSTCPGDCGTTNRVVYIHGRGFNTWPAEAVISQDPAWTHVRLDYSANKRLHDAGVRQVIRDALIAHCGTHTPNQCIIVAASAGAPRLLLAMSDVAAAGYSLRIPWQVHYASAEGGTELADKWTRGWRRFVSKLMGRRKPVDDDLRTGRLRNDYYYIHYVAQQPVYMAAGRRNEALIKKNSNPAMAVYHLVSGNWLSAVWNLLGFKITGNSHFPCRMGDGTVPVHSAGGYAYTGCNFSMCDATPKYPWRTHHTCSLFDTAHIDTIAHGLQYYAAPMLAGQEFFNSCNPAPEDIAGVPEAVTTDDSADLAGEQLEDECDRSYCMTNGESVCEREDPVDRTDTSCLAGTACYVGGTPPACGDGVCDQDEYATCCWDCNACYWWY